MIEGIKLISDVAMYQPGAIEYVVVREEFGEVPDHIVCEIFTTDKGSFKEVSQLMHPQGILAICRIPDAFFNEKWSGDGFALYFDGVQDPGNLGTMLRAAEWFGVENILIGPGTVDPYSGKVVQAAMGSHTYMRIYSCDFTQLSEFSCPVMAADMDGNDAYNIEWPERGVLILGNEGQGVSERALELATQRITLPRSRDVRTESLNVGMACTALLTLRQGYFRGE